MANFSEFYEICQYLFITCYGYFIVYSDLFDEVDDGDERDLFGSEDATNEILVGDEDDNFQSELRGKCCTFCY